MVLERVEHYLRLFFFFTLVLTQSFIFVASRAANDSSILEAVFLEPVNGQAIKIGEAVNLQAQLATANKTDLSAAYFSVVNLATGFNQNFEASRDKNNIWHASAAWETEGLVSGQYLLVATAYVYQEGQLPIMYRSTPQIFNLGSDQINAVVDVSQPIFTSPTANQVVSVNNLNMIVSSAATLSNIVFEIKSWDINTKVATGGILKTFVGDSLGNNLWGINQADISALPNSNYVLSMIADKDDVPPADGDRDGLVEGSAIVEVRAQVIFSINRASSADDDTLAATIVSPQAEQVIADSALIKLELNRALKTDESLSVKIYNNSLSLVKELSLAKSSNSLVYQATLDSTGLDSSGVSLYPDGRYRLEIVLDKSANDTKLGTINFSIKNSSSDLTNKSDTLLIDSPNANTVIKNSRILFKAETNFEADEFRVSLVNKSDQAIGTNEISIPRLDGYSWSGNIDLDNTLIDGSYTLQATASSSTTLVNASLTLTLDRQDNNSITEPQDIKASIINKRTNLSGVDFVVLASNISALDFYCQLTNSLDSSQTKDIVAATIDWQQLLGMGIKQSDYPDLSYAYLASFDTSALPNGNYKAIIKNKTYTGIDTEVFYVSIFNQSASPEDTGKTPNDDLLDKKIIIADQYDVSSDGQFANFYIEADFLTQSNNIFVFKADTSDLIKEDSFKKETATGSNGQYRYTYALGLGQLTDGKHYLYAVEYDPNTKTVLAESNIINFSVEQGRFVSVPDINTNDNTKETPYQIQNTFRGWGVGPYASCLDAYLEDEGYCRIFNAWQSSVDQVCIEQDILDWSACEDYLNRTQVDPFCQAQGIIGREQCKDYLVEKYGQDIVCQLPDQNECTQVILNNFINYLTVKEQINQSLYKLSEQLSQDKHMELRDLAAKLAAQGLDEDILPFASSVEAKVIIAPAKAEAVLLDRETLDITSPILLMVDTDSDGLPDDLEKYYGSDSNNVDTDGDSYSDFTELANGYNPVGMGKWEQPRTNFDQALFSWAKWEQPKIKSDKIDTNLNILKVRNDNGQLKLSGRAEANTLLSLYIYSEVPLVVLAKTDANGDWAYNLPLALSDGYHRAYVAEYDAGGQLIKQSEPTAFVIKDGQPIKIREYFAATTQPVVESKPWLFYILGGIGLLLFFVFIIIVFRRIKKTSATPM